MIVGLTGIPGSGKTFRAMVILIDNLKRGRIVYTNIDGVFQQDCQEAILKLTKLKKAELVHQLRQLKPSQVQRFWEHIEPKSLIVVDEAQRHWNSRNWSSQDNCEFSLWADEHRHNCCDLLLITPRITKIDSQVRGLLQWVYEFRKLDYFGSAVNNSYMQYCYDSEDTSGTPVSQKRMSYDKSIFPCYKSYFLDEGAIELGIEKPPNVLKHPVFFAIPLVLGVCIYAGCHSSLLRGEYNIKTPTLPKTVKTEMVKPSGNKPKKVAVGKKVSKSTDYIIGSVNGRLLGVNKNGEVIIQK